MITTREEIDEYIARNYPDYEIILDHETDRDERILSFNGETEGRYRTVVIKKLPPPPPVCCGSCRWWEIGSYEIDSYGAGTSQTGDNRRGNCRWVVGEPMLDYIFRPENRVMYEQEGTDCKAYKRIPRYGSR